MAGRVANPTMPNMMQEIGGYRLIHRLGRGGMADIWGARHLTLDRDAAIKVARADRLPPGCADLVRTQFETEARITASLCSPHTVRVFDSGITRAGVPFYAMELLRGCDLQAVVRRFGPLPAERALHLLTQVCHSIAEAHACGVLHRDLKPANLFVCRVGLDYDVAKVLDFGLASRERERGGGASPGLSAFTLGTPSYMAPEVIAGDPVDERADVYSLGCVAYFLLTGSLVFESDSLSHALAQHLRAQPHAPSVKAECAIPLALDELVLDCLQKDPSRRPRNASALRDRLVGIDHGRWSQRKAMTWWQMHLPEYTLPVTSVGERAQPASGAWTASIESHGSPLCPSLDALAQSRF